MKKAIITWGVFDGVHRGHQKLIRTVVARAKTVGGTPVLITFYKHPDEVILKNPPEMITSLEHRFELIGRLGVKEIIALPFSKSLMKLSPEEFVRSVLVDWLQAYGLVVNNQMRFGKGQSGDVATLKNLGRKYYLHLKIIKPVRYQGKVVSSTLIRETISSGNLVLARKLLGRPVSLLGTVIRGRGRGRKLGIPTANLNLHHQLTPPAGVYTARLKLNGRHYQALVNIGTRPTFEKNKQKVVEVHIMNYQQSNLYGKTIEVELIKKIRDEKCFRSAAELLEQIEKDKQRLRKYNERYSIHRYHPDR